MIRVNALDGINCLIARGVASLCRFAQTNIAGCVIKINSQLASCRINKTTDSTLDPQSQQQHFYNYSIIDSFPSHIKTLLGFIYQRVISNAVHCIKISKVVQSGSDTVATLQHSSLSLIKMNDKIQGIILTFMAVLYRAHSVSISATNSCQFSHRFPGHGLFRHVRAPFLHPCQLRTLNQCSDVTWVGARKASVPCFQSQSQRRFGKKIPQENHRAETLPGLTLGNMPSCPIQA